MQYSGQILEESCQQTTLNHKNNSLWTKIDAITTGQLYSAQQAVSSTNGTGTSPHGWQLFAEDGQMKLYTRELVVDGLVCDPLKAVHVVRGVTGYEICNRFFSPSTRFEWEQTLESMKVVHEIDPNTLIFHQIHKRIWPAAQRDAVFWSHIRRVANSKASNLSSDDVNPVNCPNLKLHDVWIVCNNSTDEVDIPLESCVRVKLTVSLVCETYIPVDALDNIDKNHDNDSREPHRRASLDGENGCEQSLDCKTDDDVVNTSDLNNTSTSNNNISHEEDVNSSANSDVDKVKNIQDVLSKRLNREDLVCKIIYSSTINPGGWAPASILRTVYKREYPRFLDSFSNYVKASTKSEPIAFEQ